VKITCQYSGITYDVTGFGSTSLTYIHPIFTAETKWLLSRMGTWAAQKYTEEESKLLFLALLHSTELVEFRHAAYPENNTVQLNIEPLARFIGWSSGLSRAAIVLPKFVIQHDNRKLENIRYWIRTWQDARKAFEDGYVKYERDKKLHDKEVALERLIRNSAKQVQDYAGLLATWAMQAGTAPKALHDYWRSLFCLKGISIYNAKQIDLEELLEHMEEHLEHGSIYSHATLTHLRTLVKKNKAGLNYGLGITDEEFNVLEASPFRIVEGSVEEHNMEVIIASAPNEEPQANNYPSRVAYLRAKAAWGLAQRAAQYAAIFTQQVEEETKKEDTEAAELSSDDITTEEPDDTTTQARLISEGASDE